MFFAVSWGSGGFRELREACRNHFYLSWYLSDFLVPSYGQKTSWGILVSFRLRYSPFKEPFDMHLKGYIAICIILYSFSVSTISTLELKNHKLGPQIRILHKIFPGAGSKGLETEIQVHRFLLFVIVLNSSCLPAC